MAFGENPPRRGSACPAWQQDRDERNPTSVRLQRKVEGEQLFFAKAERSA